MTRLCSTAAVVGERTRQMTTDQRRLMTARREMLVALSGLAYADAVAVTLDALREVTDLERAGQWLVADERILQRSTCHADR